jgi:signal peptidase I
MSRSGILKELIEWIKAFAFAAIIVAVLSIFFTTTMVYSTSMYPTLVEKDVLLLKKTHDVKKGDIVSFKTSMEISKSDIDRMNILQRIFVREGGKKNLIKRVIAVPGDSISIKSGVVTINGKVQNETYVSSFTNQEISYDKIPDGKYFMMGDNRMESLDSRYPEVGLIDKGNMIGKVLVRIWPLNKLGIVK